MKAKVFTFFLFLFISSKLFSQGSIKGQVLDADNGESIIACNIILQGTTLGTVTDFDGNFSLQNIPAGSYNIIFSFISYDKYIQKIEILKGTQQVLNIKLKSSSLVIKDVEVTAKRNMESEAMLLMEQKKSIIATQSIGAQELSRKGVSDANAAVAKISGVSKQEGVKNVFVRGLGDRYNSTTLNGFVLPSEDPSYKNIALEFFSNDIIQSIGVSKVFSAKMTGDIGGALIDIKSKELTGDKVLEVGVSSSLNSNTVGKTLLLPDGLNGLGYSTASFGPYDNYSTNYSFNTSLDPHTVKSPLNIGMSFSAGKKFSGKHSFFVAGSYDNKYRFEEGVLREINAANALEPFVDMTYTKSQRNSNNLLLGNLDLNFTNLKLNYNALYIHTGSQFYSDRYGKHVETFQIAEDFNSEGLIKWQQMNDNSLFVNQLSVDGKISDRLNYFVGAAVNSISGKEPDRKIFRFPSMGNNTVYFHPGENRSRRFSTDLTELSVIPKANLQYKLSSDTKNNSILEIGYDSRISNKKFSAPFYNHTWNARKLSEIPIFTDISNMILDKYFNQDALSNDLFEIEHFNDNYQVVRNMHGAYMDLVYEFGSNLTLNAGLRADYVDVKIDYDVNKGSSTGTNTIGGVFFSPNFNLKYTLNSRNDFRIGASRTFTLPQDIEISPFVREGFDGYEVGNPDLKISTNYNADVKWDFYISGNEYLSLTGFYKYILDPIARLDMANSAGIKSFNNIGDYAYAAGVELELRKNILSVANKHRLNFGVNASYIHTKHVGLDENLFVQNVNSSMEGASPYILNADLSYSLVANKVKINSTVVLNYLGDKIHTIGTRGFNNLIEESITTLDFVNSFSINNKFSIGLKLMNLLNPDFTQIRKGSDDNVPSAIIRKYSKGMNFDLSFKYNF